MFDAFFESNLLGFLQRMEGSRCHFFHLVTREEAAEVQGIVGKAIVCYPTAHLANHCHIIVYARDN